MITTTKGKQADNRNASHVFDKAAHIDETTKTDLSGFSTNAVLERSLIIDAMVSANIRATNINSTATIDEGDGPNISKVQNVELFLKKAVPFLYSSDIQSYAKQLVEDGFDSAEMIAKELTRGDLDFMKKAHARALWNAIVHDKDKLIDTTSVRKDAMEFRYLLKF